VNLWDQGLTELEELVKVVRQQTPQQPQVCLQAICVQVPADFCGRAGLTTEANQGKGESRKTVPQYQWTLTPREARLLAALIRSEPNAKLIARPQMIVMDGQTAYCNKGPQPLEVVTGLAADVRDGKAVYTLQTAKVNVGTRLQVTPKFSDDRRSVRLGVIAEHATVSGTPGQIPIISARRSAGGSDRFQKVKFVSYVTNPAVNMQTVRATAVLCGPRTSPPATDMLWLLTVRIPEGKSTADHAAADEEP
jgi:type II secretory pathway component GspD/PulD (secretin)